MARRAAWIASVVGMSSLVLGCGKPPGDLAASGTRDMTLISVGPIPGPGPDFQGMNNPFASDRAAAGAGRRLFRQFNCSGCHGEHAGGGMGPSLRDIDWLYGSEDARIFSSIVEGRSNGMPSWHTRLDPDQVWRLVAYIKSMRTRNEPEPPTE
jgi:cytochrome c oxidase cbb3-type subunit 3